MQFSNWLLEQWHDVKGNVKFWILALSGGLALGIVKALVNGLQLWQQIFLLLLFLALFGWALFTTWEIIKPRITVSTVTSATPSTPVGSPTPAYSGETLLRILLPGPGQQPKAVGQQNIFR